MVQTEIGTFSAFLYARKASKGGCCFSTGTSVSQLIRWDTHSNLPAKAMQTAVVDTRILYITRFVQYESICGDRLAESSKTLAFGERHNRAIHNFVRNRFSWIFFLFSFEFSIARAGISAGESH